MKKIFFGLLILVFASSCATTDSKIKYYSDFNKTFELNGTRVGPVDYFLEPRQMILVDSLIVVSDFETEKLFHLVTRNNYKLKNSFGSKGKGPGEFLGPNMSKRMYNNQLVVTDKSITKIYNLDSMISVPYYESNTKIDFPDELIIPYNLFYLNVTTIIGFNGPAIIGSTTSGKFRAFNFNPGTGKINYTVDDLFFKQREAKRQLHLGQIFYAINDYNYTRELFVSALRYFKQIDLYNNDLSLLASLQPENQIEPIFSKNSNSFLDDKTVFHYIDVFTTPKYIYAIYCGKDFVTATAGIGNKIHVFSWEGEALYEIDLNIGLSNIIITDDDKTLIGLNWLDRQPFVIYDLSNLI